MDQQPNSNKQRMRRLIIGFGSAAIGILIVIWLGNGNALILQKSLTKNEATVAVSDTESSAAQCKANPELAAKIDTQAVGELAAMRVTAKGDSHTPIKFKSPMGADMSIADLPGKVLLVNFWATWCGPCREEMPALNRLEEKFGGDKFEVVTISLDLGDKGLAKAQGFFSENKLSNLKLYSDPSFKSFDYIKAKGLSLGLPTSLLLDENGCELGVLTGPAEWDSEDGFATIQAAIDG